MSGARPGKRVVLLRGMPGVGKTTLARNIAKELGYPLIVKDDVRDVLHRLESRVSTGMLFLDGSPARLDTNADSYDVMYLVARTQLECGLNVIVESPLGTHERYVRFCKLAEDFGATPFLLDCTMDLESWKRRLRNRFEQGTEPAHKPHDPEAILDYYKDQLKYPSDRGPSISLDMDKKKKQSVDALSRQAVRWLSQSD